jgi:dTDP-4-amino-4,6-dideoxygalactose transaminase
LIKYARTKLAINGGLPVSDKWIPLAKPVFSNKTKKDVEKILSSGYLRQGPVTSEFEEKFKERIGSRFAYAVNSGTAALHTAFLSTLDPGDEVILPAFTFIATASTVFYSNAKPVFADIEEDTFVLDLDDVIEKISSKTKILVPVHIFGNAVDMKTLSEIAEDHNLIIISDAAQAHGTEFKGQDVGAYDTLNCYSFYPSKTITSGEGGMVTTNNEDLYRKGKLIRSHGQQQKYLHTRLGLNYRMPDILAAIGLNQLHKMDAFLSKRRYYGAKLRSSLEKIEGLTPQKIKKGANHSYSYFSLTINLDKFNCSRNEFVNAIKAENIDCAVHYPVPLTKQPAITNLIKTEKCPMSEKLCERIFSLPIHPELTEEDIRIIVAGVEKVAAHYSK